MASPQPVHTPHQSQCMLCPWISEPYSSRYLAGCRATWHVFEEHQSAWLALFGGRLPQDPDPRITS